MRPLSKIAGATGLVAVAALGGYLVRDNAAVAQSPTSASAPVANTPAVQNAAQMQTAFAQVARVAEPAVVTITTSQSLEKVREQRRQMMPRLPGGGRNDLEDLFREFRGMTPNSYKNGDAGKSGDAVVPIQGAVRPQARGGYIETGTGSGIIYDKSGLILTNAHVVADADRVTVKLLDGREFKDAEVLGSDSRSDIAVVKIPITDAPTVSLGDSSKVDVGDWAIAVGNPYGLSNTLTVGVISANAREVNLAAEGSLNDYLQTDASINPGNSGGALLDIYGRVIGVNNAIYSRTGGNVGIGFAIPINVAKAVAADLVKDGKVHRAIIGVAMSNVGDNAAAFGLPKGTKGVIVSTVQPDSPASRAGVQIGDVITGWNGEVINRDVDLQRKVAASAIGKPGTLSVNRAGKSVALSVTPKEVAGDAATPKKPAPAAPEASADNSLGIRIAPLNAQTRRAYKIASSVTGVLVGGVTNNSPAERAGLGEGDVITRVGQTPVATVAEMNRAKDALLKEQTGEKSVALYIVRANGNDGYAVLQLDD